MPPKRKASSSNLNESPSKRLARSTATKNLEATPTSGRAARRSTATLVETPSVPITPTRVVRTYGKKGSSRKKEVESKDECSRVTTEDEEAGVDEIDMLSPAKKQLSRETNSPEGAVERSNTAKQNTRRTSPKKPLATPTRSSPRKKSNILLTASRAPEDLSTEAKRATDSPASLRFDGVVLSATLTPSKNRKNKPRPRTTSIASVPATASTSDSDSGEPLEEDPFLVEKDDSILIPLPTSPSPTRSKKKGIRSASPVHVPQALPGHLHACLNAQKRAILWATQHPPEIDDDDNDDFTTNTVAAQQLTSLLSGTLNRGEGNSCLILGPRGSGKSRLVETCISSFVDENPIVIRLSGWTQHSGRLAMREIAHQLYQQTGTSFLSQGDDNADAEDASEDPHPTLESLPISKTPSAVQLPALISHLPTLNRPTIVVLDAFDLFILHPRQALLYCLLDTAQSCRAGASTKGLAVIGVTSRIDSIVHLEKRVKSRFSGRMIRTAPPHTLGGWESIAKAILSTELDNFMDSTSLDKDMIAEWSVLWVAIVEQFLQDVEVQAVWNDTFSVTRDVRMLARMLLSVVLRLSPVSLSLSSTHFAATAAVQRMRSRFPVLHTLPYPAICLLIASVHVDTAGQSIFTFEMLHECFRDQVRASTSAPVQVRGGSIGMVRCSRQVLVVAFEDLVRTRAFVAVAAHAPSIAREFIKYRSVIERENVKKAVDKMGQVNLKKWLTKAGQ